MKPEEPLSQQVDEPALQLAPDLAEALSLYRESLLPEEPFLKTLQEQIVSISQEEPPTTMWGWLQKGWPSTWKSGWLATAAACCLLLYVVPFPSGESPNAHPHKPSFERKTPQPGVLWAKGSWQVELYAISYQTRYKRKILVRQHDLLFEGDQIQFVVRGDAGSRLHLLIVSTNKQGKHAVYISEKERHSAVVLGSGQRQNLPVLELDDYVGRETIFVLSSHKRFSVQQVKQALDRAYKGAGKMLEQMSVPQGPWTVLQAISIQKKKKPFHE